MWILEPIMNVEVQTPTEFQGAVMGNLNSRRGIITGTTEDTASTTINADVPLSEMFGYVTALRTLSSGRATSTMEFSHYAETPSNISEEVIANAKG